MADGTILHACGYDSRQIKFQIAGATFDTIAKPTLALCFTCSANPTQAGDWETQLPSTHPVSSSYTTSQPGLHSLLLSLNCYHHVCVAAALQGNSHWIRSKLACYTHTRTSATSPPPPSKGKGVQPHGSHAVNTESDTTSNQTAQQPLATKKQFISSSRALTAIASAVAGTRLLCAVR